MSTVLKSKNPRSKISFKRLIFIFSAVSGLCFAVFAWLYLDSGKNTHLSAAISFGVTFYHFAMRLAVGYITDLFSCRIIDPCSEWFSPKNFEHRLYRRLRVHKWKKFMPTYSPEQFDLEKNSPDEIVFSTCRAEICHEVIIIFSLFAMFFAIPFGEFAVFLITSVLAAAFDLVFVIIQRYNRPRILRILKKR